tara:strand:- start:1046 stop:1522 length:477 start_codon:yes stop_codon:yes gene_type:complete
MSWETDRILKNSCDCGAGIFEYVQRSNDWGQFEETLIIHCPVCQAARKVIRQRRVELKEKVKLLAGSRYLAMWLALFDGLNKRQAWYRLTGENGYPSLGTFYKHVKHEGVDHYLRRVFYQDIAAALSLLGVTDEEVNSALDELNSLPDYDSRQRRLPY